jgi:hypothetical protein
MVHDGFLPRINTDERGYGNGVTDVTATAKSEQPTANKNFQLPNERQRRTAYSPRDNEYIPKHTAWFGLF